jgi:FSR family fosmidomycin resistance protein-like MFS transporter
MTTSRAAIRWLSAAHFANDFFSGSLGILLAAQAGHMDLSNTQVGIASTGYYLSSLLQPLFGWIADRTGRAYLMVSGALWTALGLVLCGFAPTFELIVLATLFGGIGNAMFHPVGLASARAFGQESGKGRSLALFMLGGNSGFAIGPFIVGFVVEGLGPRGIAAPFLLSLALLPMVMLRLRPYMSGNMVRSSGPRAAIKSASSALAAKTSWYHSGQVMLLSYLGIVLLRGTVGQALSTYMPLYYKHTGRTLAFAGIATGAMLLFGAIGSYIGSTLTDYVPRLGITVTSTLLTPPLLILLLHADGAAIFIISILLGVVVNANWPILLMIGQEVMPGGANGSSGLTFGWAFMSSAIGTFSIGVLADRVGLQDALQFTALLSLLAVFLMFTLPGDPARRDVSLTVTGERQAAPMPGD